MLDFNVKAGDETLESGARQPGLGRPAWSCLHVSPPSRGTVLIASGGQSFRRFDQPTPSWAGRAPWGQVACLWRPLGPPLHRHATLWPWINPRSGGCCMLDHGLGWLLFGYGSKPSVSKLCTSGFSPWKWLGFSLYVTL